MEGMAGNATISFRYSTSRIMTNVTVILNRSLLDLLTLHESLTSFISIRVRRQQTRHPHFHIQRYGIFRFRVQSGIVAFMKAYSSLKTCFLFTDISLQLLCTQLDPASSPSAPTNLCPYGLGICIVLLTIAHPHPTKTPTIG